MPTADDLQTSAHLIAERLPLLQQLADRARTYFSNTVSTESVAHWILQHREPAAVSMALRVLERISFIDDDKLTALLHRAFARLPQETQKSGSFASLGSPYDSGAPVGYSFAKSLGLSEADLARRYRPSATEALLDRAGDLVLIDDNITSGTQLDRMLRELMPKFEGKREHFKEPLAPEALKVLQQRSLYVIVAVELGEGVERVTATATEMSLNLSVICGTSDAGHWLDDGSPIWSTVSEARAARDFYSKVGRQLLADRDWEAARVASHVLGYGGLQQLTVFPHNVPKSLLTALWKAGEVNGRYWQPLFPERREWQAYKDKIVEAEPEIRALSNLTISGAFGRASSSPLAYICDRGQPSTRAELIVPDESSAAAAAEMILEDAPVAAKMSPHAIDGFASGFLGPSADSIREYNADVDDFDRELVRYSDEVKATCKIATRAVSFTVRVYNQGTAPCVETVLDLELPTGTGYLQTYPRAPKPPRPPIKPSYDVLSRAVIGKIAKGPGTLLEEIRDSLAGGPAPPYKYITPVSDRGKNYLRVFFGKVVQGTFRDRDVQWLILPAVQEYQLPYRVLSEDARRPVEGSFTLVPRAMRHDPLTLSEDLTSDD